MEDLGRLKGKVNPDFWRGKKVFITGHTGFKGSWLSLWLQDMQAVVKGFALEPNTTPNLFTKAKVAQNMDSEIGDITDLNHIAMSMKEFNPEVLIHMAAQPLVRLSYRQPILTYSTNVMGTESARKCSNLRAIVSVTTDKCYENKEWEWGYRENEPLGGSDPYSSSKGCAELVTGAYRKSFFYDTNSAFLASARAGNVIGGGDWSADRLIPDVLRAFENNEPVIVRNPKATRPWQHVLEPLSGYLVLAQHLYEEGNDFAESWNFGPRDEDCKPVSWILDKMIAKWGNGATWKLDKKSNLYEAGFLKLDCSKAAMRLNWYPKWNLDSVLESIINWHKHYLSEKSIQAQCLLEIAKYKKD